MIYRGRRFRFPGETCPCCQGPGCGMVLSIPRDEPGLPGARWICSRCARKEREVTDVLV